MVGGMRASLVTTLPAGYHASANDWHIVIAVVLEMHLHGLVPEALPACTTIVRHRLTFLARSCQCLLAVRSA